MKKTFFVVLALSVFGLANAQKFKFGPKAGIVMSTITATVTSSIDKKIKIGALVGGVAEIKFTDKISLQPELQVSLQGASFEYDFNYVGGYEEHKDNLDLIYIQVPVMAKYYIVKGFNVGIGPQLGILVSAKNRTEVDFTDGSESKTFDVKDNYKTIDLGANFGLGYDFPNGIFIDARYTLGVADIGEGAGGNSIKNNVIAVSGGFKF